MKSLIDKKGFTLIELLLVIALVIGLATISIPIYSDWHMTTELDETAARIADALKQAKEFSQAGKNDARFGVNFQSDRFILNEKAADGTVTEDRQDFISTSIALTDTFPGDEIYFSHASGTPNATGAVSLSWQNLSRTIKVNSLGVAEIE